MTSRRKKLLGAAIVAAVGFLVAYVPMRIALAALGESWFWERPLFAIALGLYGLLGAHHGGLYLGSPLAHRLIDLEAEDQTGWSCGTCGDPVAIEWEGEECPGCGEELVNYETDKRHVAECEWCDERFASNIRSLMALRATIHALRSHPDDLEEDYA